MESKEQLFICSKCGATITDETEYIDNSGICDDCYSIPFKKRIAIILLKK